MCNGFSGNCTWIIIILLLLCCCGGNNGISNNSCGGCGCDNNCGCC
ncbi:MAG: hypothetical protein J6B93_07095 [Clostridia bacterium]|nr:hypothetical protein [Clostridia bacterium]MBO5201029.1 hypothetical protein [Clostridia bacterium]